MRNEIIEKIEKRCAKLNPKSVSMTLEISASEIMDLLFELKKDNEYTVVAEKAIYELTKIINKEVYNAVLTELRAGEKRASKGLKETYYKTALETIELIRSAVAIVIQFDK